jgi:hypothetical protein
MDEVVARFLDAVETNRMVEERFLLHPYLHWTGPEGDAIRGRTKVLAQLAEHPPSAPPESYELRDGQIYRWVEPKGRSESCRRVRAV